MRGDKRQETENANTEMLPRTFTYAHENSHPRGRYSASQILCVFRDLAWSKELSTGAHLSNNGVWENHVHLILKLTGLDGP
mmetsp:Transcript_13464/g.19409  ORF Transcript_13464/g.19409 Transcript_13464/m.19409 type:complete len:81 (+) Transcript_13464:1187-1429(+)